MVCSIDSRGGYTVFQGACEVKQEVIICRFPRIHADVIYTDGAPATAGRVTEASKCSRKLCILHSRNKRKNQEILTVR